VGHLKVLEPQKSLQHVLEDIRPEIADVGVIVDGRTARIEFDLPGFDGREGLFLAAQRVEELDHAGLL
jgi:hypothetical protein